MGRWWRLDGLREMRALLWEQWDPLGLRAHGVPEDEYDNYANVLASKLKRGNSHAGIARYLTTTRPEDRPITAAWIGRCEQPAQDLLDWYAKSGAPH